MYENSLILRICMTEKPLYIKKHLVMLLVNFMFHETLAKNLLSLIDIKEL